MNGALAVVVAAPCTIPFMGVAIGYAFSQPAVITFFVFTALALGMALPYVLLAWFPRWLKRLPKPGRWMERLKQLLAFPLYGTVVWLAWVLGAQSGFESVIGLLVALVVLALALWLAGQASTRWARAAAFFVAVSAIPVALPRADSMQPPTPAPASANASAAAEVITKKTVDCAQSSCDFRHTNSHASRTGSPSRSAASRTRSPTSAIWLMCS